MPHCASWIGQAPYAERLIFVPDGPSLATCLKKRVGPLSKGCPWALRAGQGQLATSTRHVSEVDQQEPQVEPHGLRMGETAPERAEAREGKFGPVLVVQ